VEVAYPVKLHFTENRGLYCSLAYSALACFRMGMSESASFQRVKKCRSRMSRLGFLQENNVRVKMAAQDSEILSIRRQAE
jgi:hypothetical protein